MINDLKRVKIEYNVKRILKNILKHVKMEYVCHGVKRNC